VRPLLAWVALWWLWLLLAGEWNRDEWIAAAISASIATALTEVACRRAGVRAHVPPGVVARSWSALPTVFLDFGILMWALVRGVLRREVPRGVFRRRASPARGHDPTAVGARAWVTIAAGLSPNAYVVELDSEHVLLHDLVPFRPSEQPA
jgi:hypothetical protein